MGPKLQFPVDLVTVTEKTSWKTLLCCNSIRRKLIQIFVQRGCGLLVAAEKGSFVELHIVKLRFLVEFN